MTAEHARPLPIIPREVLWLCVVGPWITAYVFGTTPKTMEVYLEGVAGGYVPFIAIPAAIYLLYGTVMPYLLPRVPYFALQVTLHLLITAALSGAVSLLVQPILEMIHPSMGDDPLHFAVISMCIGCALVVPGVIVQRLRAHLISSELRVQQEREAALEAQLQALQARTNPHFLFNSINTVASLIPDDPKLAEETLERLADIFRYALDSGRTRFVALARELEIVRDYLEVQATRFKGRLSYTLTVDDAVEPARIRVPPLVLQPLVENAVLHGVADRPQGGRVALVVSVDGDDLTLTVDNDVARGGSRYSGGSGTSTRELRERLRLVYGPAGRLETAQLPEGRYRARLSVPIDAEQAR